MEFSIDLIGQFTQQIIPLIILMVTGLLLMLLDAFSIRRFLPWVAGAGLVLSSAWALINANPESQIAFYGMIETGGIAPMVHVFLSLSGVLTLFFLPDYLQRQAKPIHEVYALLIFAVIGMIIMATANDLIMTFIGLETMSICLYIFAALYKRDPKSNEAGFKYFLLGSFASTFLLFGISLIYGITQHTNLDMIASRADVIEENQVLFFISAGLILIGFFFKVAAFPFHNWTPDVYEGTPTPLAGFMSTGSKMAAFISLVVILQKLELVQYVNGSLVQYDKIVNIIAVSALITMIYGNVVAVRQKNLKRMLAYSSIAHSGYALLGLCAGREGFMAILFYMFIYTLMNIGAFGIIGIAEQNYEDTDSDRWRGLGKKAPYFAGALAVFLFSLAGIPPLAGFMSKYQVFISAIRADLTLLAVIGILTSVIGAFYYIRVIVLMFFEENDKQSLSTKLNPAPLVGIVLLVSLIIIFGIFPSLILGPIDQIMQSAGSSFAIVP